MKLALHSNILKAMIGITVYVNWRQSRMNSTNVNVKLVAFSRNIMGDDRIMSVMPLDNNAFIPRA